MRSEACLTTAAIRTIFTEEVTAAGGRVSDVVADETRLFARSVLPWTREVREQDQLQGGVALRATDGQVWVHPYVFRQVCSNGAIMAQAVQSRRISDLAFLAPDEAESAVREAVRACCVEDALATFTADARSAIDVQADLALNLMSMMARVPEGEARRAFLEIIDRFLRDRDSSQFGLMNAVTSVARDTRDPETRWRLEELGGAIPSQRDLTPRPGPVRAARTERVLQPVG